MTTTTNTYRIVRVEVWRGEYEWDAWFDGRRVARGVRDFDAAAAAIRAAGWRIGRDGAIDTFDSYGDDEGAFEAIDERRQR